MSQLGDLHTGAKEGCNAQFESGYQANNQQITPDEPFPVGRCNHPTCNRSGQHNHATEICNTQLEYGYAATASE